MHAVTKPQPFFFHEREKDHIFCNNIGSILMVSSEFIEFLDPHCRVGLSLLHQSVYKAQKSSVKILSPFCSLVTLIVPSAALLSRQPPL